MAKRTAKSNWTGLGILLVIGLIALGALWSGDDAATTPTMTNGAQALSAVTRTLRSTAARATLQNTRTRTPRRTNTARQTATERQQSLLTQMPETTYYASTLARLRPCPNTTAECAPVETVDQGTALGVIASISGEVVSGSSTWYLVIERGQQLYVHSSIVTRQKPSSSVVQNTPLRTQAFTSTSIWTDAPSLTDAPVFTDAPPPTSGSEFACNCSKTCGQIATCSEAYYQLNTCGCTARDDDGDGVPCEALCS